MMLLRRTVHPVVRRCTRQRHGSGLVLSSRRHYAAAATSAKKRKLQKLQSAAAAAAATRTSGGSSSDPTKSTSTAPPSSSSSPPLASSTNESSSVIPIIAIGGLVAAGGAAYYLDLLNLTQEGEDVVVVEEKESSLPTVVKEEITGPSPVVVVKTDESSVKAEETEAPVVEQTTTKPVSKTTTTTTTTTGGSRVTSIQVPTPTTTGRRPAMAKIPSHPLRGHRVSMTPPTVSKETSVMEAAKELEISTLDQTSQTLAKARQAFQSDIDVCNVLAHLDTATPEELKLRIVQLVTNLQDRTKWEAIRLKEFMTMKEKETIAQYMEILQKQRLEYEGLLATRLREQEETLTRQANVALQQKEDAIQAVVKANADAQDVEHKADLESTERRLNAELDAKYETSYADKLAEAKAQYVTDLEDKVRTMEQLTTKLQRMEKALEGFKSFEIGSVNAHRLSAAALAFSEKLETDKPAGQELELLKNAAGDNEVIMSAISTVPSSIDKGIPTLPELQTRFETVYKRSRQAALVPPGRVGLGGQLLGMVFATVKYAPEPDDAAPQDGRGENEYLLVRARKLVQLGELERAIEQLEKLDGQSAFTAKDWTADAKDRVAAEKAAKVIKMELAIVNESMSEQATV